MIKDITIAILWSISPFGEAKVGIPYGLLNELNIYLVFVVCFLANVLVFPLMMFFLEKMNTLRLKTHLRCHRIQSYCTNHRRIAAQL